MNHRSKWVRAWAPLLVGLCLQPLSAHAVNKSTEGRGTAIVIPYYTVVDSWRTLINVTNTSANSLAVKLRFHEASNGRDVLHFTLLLPPFDVWAGWLSQGQDGRPILRTGDRSCTVPLSLRDEGMVADERAYSTSSESSPVGWPGRFTDHSGTNGDVTRMHEGYATVLVMGEVFGRGAFGSIPWYAQHEDGEPRDCERVEEAFEPTTTDWDGLGEIPGTNSSGDPSAAGGAGYGVLSTPAPLKVNVTLVNQDQGIAAGISSTGLEDWGVGEKLVTAEAYPWGLEPTLASHKGLWSTDGLGIVDDALSVHSIANEWATNPRTGTSTDWVLTYPTKRFQTDQHASNVSAGCNVWRAGGTPGEVFDGWNVNDPGAPRQVVRKGNFFDSPNCPSLGFTDFYENVFQQGNNGRATVTGGEYRVRGREGEQDVVLSDEGGTVDAPAFAANVLVFNEEGTGSSALNARSPLYMGSALTQAGLQMGWTDLRYFLPEDRPSVPTPPPGSDRDFVGVVGFLFKLRDFGNPERNFSQAASHTTKRWLAYP